MKKKTQKKNPQDLTLRNLRALKKRIEKIEALIDCYFGSARITTYAWKSNAAKRTKT